MSDDDRDLEAEMLDILPRLISKYDDSGSGNGRASMSHKPGERPVRPPKPIKPEKLDYNNKDR